MFKLLSLTILTPISIILLALFLIIMISFINKKKSATLLNNTILLINSEREVEINSIFNRVGSIADSNPKYIELVSELNIVHTDFLKNMSLATEGLITLADVQSNIKFSLKKFKFMNKKLLELSERLIKIEIRFKDLSSQVTDQDVYIRKNFTFYKKCVREAVKVYNEKRLLLDLVKDEISKLNNNIKNTERYFEDAINKANMKDASIYQRKYIIKAEKFISVVNEGPAIAINLKQNIPSIVKKLTNVYIEKKGNNIPLNQIKFNSSIKDIAKKFKLANTLFKNLEIGKCEDKIREILKGFKMLENMINLEVRSRNVFIKMYENIIIEIKRVLEKWVSIKNQFKNLVEQGVTLNNEIYTRFKNVKESMEILDSSGIAFRNLMKKRHVPYSSKVKQGQIVIENCLKSVNLLNGLVRVIWAINSVDTINKQKFDRADHALNELLSQTKKQKIKMSDIDLKTFSELEDFRNIISENINDKITKDKIELIDKFSNKVTDFYSLISGNIQIAIHLKNILNEYASKRALNSTINLGLQHAERKYMEGNYSEGLNIAIQAIQNGGKHG